MKGCECERCNRKRERSRKYMREYRERNRERLREYRERNRERDRERESARHREYYARNRERLRERRRERGLALMAEALNRPGVSERLLSKGFQKITEGSNEGDDE